MDIPSANDIKTIASLLAPGLLILGIRARFRDGAVPDLKEQVVAYAVASSAYYAAIHPLFDIDRGITLPQWLWSLLHYFVVPCVIAGALVWFDQSERFYQFASKLGVRLSHHIPAAWDYAFAKMVKGTYVLVKLNDGTLYAGKMARRSFASSSTAERDLYIEEVWDSTSTPWKPVEPRRAVLLCGKDVRWVEIFERN